jgi:hypothetical protein
MVTVQQVMEMLRQHRADINNTDCVYGVAVHIEMVEVEPGVWEKK